jgi:hypothetical protein
MSSNTSSNADNLDRIDADSLKHIGADQPNHRTASDDFGADRAHLLIRRFHQPRDGRGLASFVRECSKVRPGPMGISRVPLFAICDEILSRFKNATVYGAPLFHEERFINIATFHVESCYV